MYILRLRLNLTVFLTVNNWELLRAYRFSWSWIAVHGEWKNSYKTKKTKTFDNCWIYYNKLIKNLRNIKIALCTFICNVYGKKDNILKDEILNTARVYFTTLTFNTANWKFWRNIEIKHPLKQLPDNWLQIFDVLKVWKFL